MKLRQTISTFLFILLCQFAIGQDLRSGEIAIQNIGPSNYRITIFLYTQISTSVNRPDLTIHFGSGDTGVITTPTPTIVFSNVYQYVYTITHIYPGPGTYSIWVDIPNYVSGITNILNSGSENLVLSKTIVLNPFLGNDDSPVFMISQEFECGCGQWIYNPGAYDPDGDSLSYSLVPCMVSNYAFSGASIDSITGDLTFIPGSIGRYAIAIQVDEWRNGNGHLGSTVRQMLLDVNSISRINELSSSLQFDLFPDPATDVLTISSLYRLDAGGTIEIYNTLGEKVAKHSSEISGSDLTIDISGLEQGLYSCKLNSGRMVAVKKFLKM